MQKNAGAKTKPCDCEHFFHFTYSRFCNFFPDSCLSSSSLVSFALFSHFFSISHFCLSELHDSVPFCLHSRCKNPRTNPIRLHQFIFPVGNCSCFATRYYTLVFQGCDGPVCLLYMGIWIQYPAILGEVSKIGHEI